MTTPDQSGETTPPRQRSILRAIVARVVLYSALCAIVVASLTDIGSLWSRSRETPSSAAGGETFDAATAAVGQGWPQLRGPTYDGHSTETDLADSWPAAGPPILWTKEIGHGFGGFAAHGTRVYTQTQSLTEQKVIALDADTGRVIWEHAYGWPYQAAGMFPGPRATPTCAAGRIYFTAPNGLVGCLDDAAGGRVVWTVNVVERFKGRGATFGYACSPVVEGGKVVLPVGGPSASVVALDADTGATRWASGDAPASYCSALPVTFRGRRQVVTFLQNSLAGFDLATGRPLWEQHYARGFDEHAAAPLYREPYLRVMQAYRAGSDLYELQPADNAEVGGEATAPGVRITRVRHDAPMSNDVASSVLVDGFVYGFDLRDQQTTRGHPSHGTFRCIDFITGRVRWSSDRPGQSAILVADGKLLMLNDSGELLLLRASPDRYEELARASVFPSETCWTAPALDRGRLYLRSPTRAACVFVGDPRRMTPRQRARATPLAAAAQGMRQSAAADLTWLLGGQREYPFEMPDVRELTRWYLFSLAALAAAALTAAVVQFVMQSLVRAPSSRIVMSVFWTTVPVLAVLATPLANRRVMPSFVFTWPLALVAAQQIAINAIRRSKTSNRSAADSEFAVAAALALLTLTCLAYFKLTRQLSLAPAWYFLVALPATWPLAIPAAAGAARRLARPGAGIAGAALWLAAAFSACFWTAGAIMLVRTAKL